MHWLLYRVLSCDVTAARLVLHNKKNVDIVCYFVSKVLRLTFLFFYLTFFVHLIALYSKE